MPARPDDAGPRDDLIAHAAAGALDNDAILK
jgi:hypothetical protein